MADTTQTRWFHLTPGRFVLGLLAVEGLLWLSERFGWLGWHKGYAVLTAVAVVGVAMLLMLVWFGVAVIFRRRFQFSIRSLLVLVVVVALPCSWFAVKMKTAKQQKEAVDHFAKLGGTVEYDWRVDANGEQLPNPQPPQTGWLWKLLGDDFFSDVCSIEAPGVGGTFTDTDLRYLGRMPQLRALYLNNTQVTDSGLEYLEGLSQLRQLWLPGTQITDAGLEHVRGLNQLQCLGLSSTKVTDTGLEQLEGLTQLIWLQLEETQVTDAGLVHLRGMVHLKSLFLTSTKTRDAGLKQLTNLRQLERLELGLTEVTDAAVEHLKDLTELQRLSLYRTKAGAGLWKLQQALPNCYIEY